MSERAASASPVASEKHGDITLITVDHPPVNALSVAVRRGLFDEVAAADADPDCTGMVIQCAGRTFIAGADIREFGKPPEAPSLPDLVARIEACNKPVVAAIHGTALGGGFEVALGCHRRIALESAAVGLPEVNLGLLPGATGTQRLPRLTGPEKALRMMLSGKPVGAAEALEIGAIDRIATGDLQGEAIRFTRSIAGQPLRRVRDLPVSHVPATFFATERKLIEKKTRGLLSPGKIIDCVENATKLDFDAGCVAEREAFLQCMASPQSEGLRHAFFAEKAAAKVPGIAAGTEPRPIETVGVIGAGTMGAGIAYNCLTSGLKVVLLDNSEAGLERGAKTVSQLAVEGVARGKISDKDRASAESRFSTSLRFTDLAHADLVIEAVFENMALKKALFTELDSVVKNGAVLASNTSTLSIDEIASATHRPIDVIGMHFFSPAHLMRLLEIVRGTSTSDDVIVTATALAKRLGKIGVVVGNCFGFVGNRMLYSYGRESQLLLLEGAEPQSVDKALTDFGMAMGPNAVGDLAGLDVGYKTRQERPDPPDDPRFYRVADMLVEMGRFGQKSGKGMYLYEKSSRTPIPDPDVSAMIRAEAKRLDILPRDIDAQEIVDRCIYGLVVEGARILEDGIVRRASDIDVVWINGYGFPRYRGGPMHYADVTGLDKVLARVREFETRFGSMYWEPPALLVELAETGRRFGDFGNGG